MPLAELLRRHALRLAFHQVVLLGQGLTGARSLRAVIGAWLSFARMLPQLLRERRSSQATVSVATYRIEAVLTREYPGSPRLLTAAMGARVMAGRLLAVVGVRPLRTVDDTAQRSCSASPARA